MDSSAWPIVTAAAVGALAGLVGGYVQRRWEERNRRAEALEDVVVQLLSASLMPIAEIGWYASPAARRYLRFRTRYAIEAILRPLTSISASIAEAKSRLDLMVKSERLSEAANEVLESITQFVEVISEVRPPKDRDIERALDGITVARNEFLVVSREVLQSNRRLLPIRRTGS